LKDVNHVAIILRAMIKTADRSTTDSRDVRGKRHAFSVYLFEVSWKMLGAMLLPLFIGIYIDSTRDYGQAFSLGGFFVGLVLSIVVLVVTVQKISRSSD